jgi:hypothetical protein
VASPADSRVSAWTAAGLLAGYSRPIATGRSIEGDARCSGGSYLHEVAGLDWSARSYLDPGWYQPRPDPASAKYHPLGPGDVWEVSSSDETGLGGGSSDRSIHVHHLGPIGESSLEWLESRHAVRRSLQESERERQELVWCIEDRHAESLVAAHSLGRLLAALDVGQLEILVFPDPKPRTGSRKWKDRIPGLSRKESRPDRPALREIVDLVSYLGTDFPARVTQLDAPADGSLARSSFAALHQVAIRLIDRR